MIKENRITKCFGKVDGSSSKYECKCGKIFVCEHYFVKVGRIRSCGCLQRDRTAAMGRSNRTHGRRHSVEWEAWHAMHQRCYNPKCASYRYYGGKGITVCHEWSSFEVFFSDMGDRPDWANCIDRKNSSLNYCKDNCRWATWETQNNNRPGYNRFISAFGSTKTAAQWSRDPRCKVGQEALRQRIRHGVHPEKALSLPPRSVGKNYAKAS